MTFEELAERIADRLFDAGLLKASHETVKNNILKTLIQSSPSQAPELENAFLKGLRD